MGPNERRARERADTRTTILDAARDMFAELGLEAVTMRAIARRIEYTPTAIYHHFRDKNELITELCHHDFRTLAVEFQKIGRVEDPIERVRQAGIAYVEFGLTHPSHYRVMFMIQTPPVDVTDRDNPEENAYVFLQQAMVDGIAQGCFRPEFTDADGLAQAMWAAVHGVVSLRIAKHGDAWIPWRDVRESARTVMEAMLRGVVRDPAML